MSTIVEYVLNLKDNFSKSIQGANQHVKELEGSMGNTRSMALKLGETMGIAFGAYEIVNFVKESHKAYEELEQAQAKVEANLKSTGEIAGISGEELKNYVTDLRGHVQASRAELTDMASQLLTFPAITKDVFQSSMGLVADIAKQTGHGLSETAIMYGKALNDPVQGLQKMMRYGVMFTDAEKQKITLLEQSGHLIESQKFMMEAIAHSGYAGVAKSMFDADAMSRFNLLLENAKIKLGEYSDEILRDIMPNLEGLTDDLISVIKFTKDHAQAIILLGEAFLTYKSIMLGIIGLQKLYVFWQTASKVATELKIVWDMYQIGVLSGLTAAQWALNIAMAANPIGLIIAGIVALGAGVYALTKHFGGFKEMMVATWDFMKTWLHLAIGLWKSLGELVIGIFMAPFDKGAMFKQGLNDYVGSIKDAANDVVDIWHNQSDEYRKASVIGSGEQGGYGMMGGVSILPGAGGLMDQSLIPKAAAGTTGKPGMDGETRPSPKTKAEGQKTINIHVAYNAPLIKDFTISTTNIKEGLGELKAKVSAILTGATHDSLMVADY